MRAATTIVVTTLMSGACSYGPVNPVTASTPPASNLTPARIVLDVSSNANQTIAVAARVESQSGQVVPGVVVAFAIGAGTITPSAATTDSTGIARAQAATPSATTITASGAGLSQFVNVPASTITQPGPTPPNLTPTPPNITTTPIILNLPSSGSVNSTVTMSVSASATAGTWTWNFGDGATATTSLFNTTHKYTVAGTYTVTVSSAAGSATGVITIS